ncbi:N/A [soil metagenome]
MNRPQRSLRRVARPALLFVLMAALTSAAVVSPAGSQVAVARHTGRPNVLIILTDDQRWDTLGVMPRTRRWFAKGGTRFTEAFATTPLCCPSRASIMSGRYAHNHGVHNNKEGALFDERLSIQRYLDEAGYRNGIFGKFLNGWDLARNPRYFDEWSIFGSSKDHYNGGTWNVNGELRDHSKYGTTYIARRAVRFIKSSEEEDDDQPWFMYLAPPAPHLPATPAPEDVDAAVPPWDQNPDVLEEDRSDKPEFVQARELRPRRVRAARSNQLRSLLSVDALVDRVLRAMAKHGEKRPTIAFFLSDNGFLWGEHGLFGKGVTKRPPYTESVRIPLLVRWPGHVPRRESDSRLVANIDIAPTVLDAARLSPDVGEPMDGRSLLDAGERQRLLLEYFLDVGPTPEWASTRTPEYQYVEYYGSDGLQPTFREFYDMRFDPWQLDNLLGDDDLTNDPDVSGISSQLDRDRRCVGAGCP